jgi:hypothetical protein
LRGSDWQRGVVDIHISGPVHDEKEQRVPVVGGRDEKVFGRWKRCSGDGKSVRKMKKSVRETKVFAGETERSGK